MSILGLGKKHHMCFEGILYMYMYIHGQFKLYFKIYLCL
jgi:hypothetical protein